MNGCGGYAQLQNERKPLVPVAHTSWWSRWKALCWLFDHAWIIHPAGGFRCACGASCAVRPGTEIQQ